MADDFGEIEFYRSDPRSIMELDDLHVSKSLARVIRKGIYEVYVDRDFQAVIQTCADREQTWINAEIIEAYIRLHEEGKAHSIEAYYEDRLVGGLYGVTLGGAFMGESMFSHRSDASKVCFYYLIEHLKDREYILLDCQIQNDHLARMGAVEISEGEYLKRLNYALGLDRNFA